MQLTTPSQRNAQQDWTRPQGVSLSQSGASCCMAWGPAQICVSWADLYQAAYERALASLADPRRAVPREARLTLAYHAN